MVEVEGGVQSNAMATLGLLQQFMQPDMQTLMQELGWVMKNRKYMQLGMQLSEYALQYAISSLLSDDTLGRCSKFLATIGFHVQPVTVGTLAKQAARVGLDEIKQHPMQVIKSIEEVVHSVNELSSLEDLGDDHPYHKIMAHLVLQAKHFPELLSKGKAVYKQGGAVMNLVLPEVLAAVHKLKSTGIMHTAEELQDLTAKQIANTYRKWISWGKVHAEPATRALAEMRKMADGDASGDEDGEAHGDHIVAVLNSLSEAGARAPSNTSAKVDTKPSSTSAKVETKPSSTSAKVETKPSSTSAKVETKPSSTSAKVDTKTKAESKS